MNSKLIVFFAIIAVVFAEEMKMDDEMKKEEPVEMPELAKFPPGVDEKLCPDYPNCDNLLLHTPMVDVVKSIKIKGDLPVETVIGAYPYSYTYPSAYPYSYIGGKTLLAPTLAAPGIVAAGMVAPIITGPKIAYPGLTSRILINNLW